ncbi:MAG: ParB/RepB/Spo0J family partition protein [Chloroflexota bacterium]|nr:ParB/RepB/Spo0J family partition protein [Chloroflexota bacterium]MDE3193579.1 ParB/RepB/Spo0J family partition protein [Chloroflexota bacterium]
MRTGLGRGLDVLLGQSTSSAAAPSSKPSINEIPLEKIVPNPQQPRRVFPADEMEQLAASIKRHGVLQPIVVSRSGDGYELVAGHRRVLASRLAGRTSIAAVVRDDVSDRLELALVENVQRADLNALEEARAYRLLMETYGLTQQQVGERVGKAQPTIANTLRILEAPQILQDALSDGKISEAHVLCLLQLHASQTPTALAEVLAKHLSVRETDALARRLAGRHAKPNGRVARGVDPEVRARTADLRAALGTKVEIVKGRKGGSIRIDFYSDDEFQRLFEMLTQGTK